MPIEADFSRGFFSSNLTLRGGKSSPRNRGHFWLRPVEASTVNGKVFVPFRAW